MLQINPVKAFNDNYLWVFHHPDERSACVVDPGDAKPVLEYLAANNLTLTAILVTHHHADHIGGVNDLLSRYNVPVYGPASARIPQVTHSLKESDQIDVIGINFKVLEVPGHTLEHIAYYAPAAANLNPPVLFCGDTLFAAGCGRMFEGTPPMMHGSLQKLASLPLDTKVFCTHEYTLSNLKFATAVMPGNANLQKRIHDEKSKRDQDLPTLPSSIELELETNPFLRCSDSQVITSANSHAKTEQQDPATIFGILRRWKDNF
ncbi:MAG: hydroxyacylglutathione hydrolase [Pseudomonadota bacterium]